MLIMIDNYDSFTYNLVQYFGELGTDIKVFRNDEISIESLKQMNPDHIVISPGPGRPEGAGISVDVIKNFVGKIPILGVCLGHQCIGYAYGGRIVGAASLMHGKTSKITHHDSDVFKGLSQSFSATRYHSLVIEEASLPDELEVTARSDDNEIMGIRHKTQSLWGVQFHPESILTVEGQQLLANFLKLK